MTRTATFMGFLHFEDYHADQAAKTVTIHVGEHIPDSKVLETLPSELRAQTAAVLGRTYRGPVTRSARPFGVFSQPWLAGYAGIGAEDLGRHAASDLAPAAADEAGLPPGDVEVWMLPVTEFVFRYIVTPAQPST